MDSLIFSLVENIPGVNARAAFTFDSTAVFREDCDIMPSTFGYLKIMRKMGSMMRLNLLYGQSKNVNIFPSRFGDVGLPNIPIALRGVAHYPSLKSEGDK